jgi:hypothetical protein
MLKCLKGEVVRSDAKDFITFLAPVKNRDGEVTGFVQVATRVREIE